MPAASTTSDDILRCARSLLIHGGYNGFSYADIAKVVGIRNASIHHHFPSKAELVRTLVSGYREEAAAGLAALERAAPDPRGQLLGYVGHWEACIANGSAPFCVCALLASEISALPEEVVPEVRAHFRLFASWLTSVLERGSRQGVLRFAGPAEAEAETLLAGVHGAMLSARAYGDPGVFAIITRPLLERLMAPQ